MSQELTVVKPVIPEATETSVQVNICLHQVILALEVMAHSYPLERLAQEQIDRIKSAAYRMQERLNETRS